MIARQDTSVFSVVGILIVLYTVLFWELQPAVEPDWSFAASNLTNVVFEEVLFRMTVLSWFSDRPLVGVVASSLFFSLAHLLNLGQGMSNDEVFRQMFVAGVTGLFSAVIYVRTGKLWIPVVFHSWTNALQLGHANPVFQGFLVLLSCASLYLCRRSLLQSLAINPFHRATPSLDPTRTEDGNVKTAP